MKIRLSPKGWESLTESMKSAFLAKPNQAVQWEAKSNADSSAYEELELLINESIYAKMSICWAQCENSDRCRMPKKTDDLTRPDFISPCQKERSKIPEDRPHVSRRSLMELLHNRKTNFQSGFIEACLLFIGRDLKEVTDDGTWFVIKGKGINSPIREGNIEMRDNRDCVDGQLDFDEAKKNRFYFKYKIHLIAVLFLFITYSLIVTFFLFKERMANNTSEKLIRSFYENLSNGIEYQELNISKSQENFKNAWMCFSMRLQADRKGKFLQFNLPEEFGQLYIGSGKHTIEDIKFWHSNDGGVQEADVTYRVSEFAPENPLTDSSPNLEKVGLDLKNNLIIIVSDKIKECYEVNDTIKLDSSIAKITLLKDLDSPGLIKSLALQLKLKRKPMLESKEIFYTNKIKIVAEDGTPKIDEIKLIKSWRK